MEASAIPEARLGRIGPGLVAEGEAEDVIPKRFDGVGGPSAWNRARVPVANRFVRLLKAMCVVAGVVFLLRSAFAEGGGPSAGPAQPDWQAEIGTVDTEKALNLTPADQAEIQERLKALGLYQGPPTGTLDEPTRFAITEWQKSRGVALSSFLGPLQWAELRVESEDAYLKLLGAQAAPAPAQATRPPAQAAKPAASRPVQATRPAPRVAKEPAKAPVRHVAKRSAPASAPEAPAAAPTCNGTPAWCRQAGLPVSGATPHPGRPAAFNGGFGQ